jgi:hypothetical protein
VSGSLLSYASARQRIEGITATQVAWSLPNSTFVAMRCIPTYLLCLSVAWLRLPAACFTFQVISDIRGLEKILKVASTPALYACFFCWLRGLRVCNKTVYIGHHTLLPEDHPLRAILARLTEQHAAECPGCKGHKCDVEHAKAPDSVVVPSNRTNEQLKLGELCCSICVCH